MISKLRRTAVQDRSVVASRCVVSGMQEYHRVHRAEASLRMDVRSLAARWLDCHLRKIFWRTALAVLWLGNLMLKYKLVGGVGLRHVWVCADYFEDRAVRLRHRY